MDQPTFDRLSRSLAVGLSRRSLAALTSLALAAVAAPADQEAKKKKKKSCKGGLTRCTVKTGKKKKTICVNGQNDPSHCGGCGRACAGGQTCRSGECADRACTPDSTNVTCDGKCGVVVNNCGTQVDCGVCGCTAWVNQTSFGTRGNGTNQFSHPLGVSVSTDGLTAWIADSINHRISVWTRPTASSAAWANQTTFGKNGFGPYDFIEPRGVSVSADGLTACVVDDVDRVSVWTRPFAGSIEWTYQTKVGSHGTDPDQFYDPFDVAVSADGLTLWVADTYNHRISVWTRPSTGSTEWTHRTNLGTEGTGASQLLRPMGVAASVDGLSVWIADQGNDRVSVWTRPDAGSTAWANQTTFGTKGTGPSRFQRPMGVAVSADGLKVWVADFWNYRISIWTRPAAGSTAWANLTTFGKKGAAANQLDEPMGVAATSDGMTALVADLKNHRISVWSLPCTD